MKMALEEISSGITKILLEGDLDAKGSAEIDLQFQAIAASRPKVVIDLSKVGFLASIGIRTLLQAAKANHGRGGKLVLLDPIEPVHKVLVTCGAIAILPVVHGLDAALAGVG